MKQPLTKKQLKTLQYLKYYKKRYKLMPTILEIAKHFKIAISTAWERVDHLQRKNWIIRETSSSWIKIK